MYASTKSADITGISGETHGVFETLGGSPSREAQLSATGAVAMPFLPPASALSAHPSKVILLDTNQRRQWAPYLATFDLPAPAHQGVSIEIGRGLAPRVVWAYLMHAPNSELRAVATFSSASALADARVAAAAASGSDVMELAAEGPDVIWATATRYTAEYERVILQRASDLPGSQRPPAFAVPPALSGDQQGRLTVRWQASHGPYDARILAYPRGAAADAVPVHVHVGAAAARRPIKQLLSVPSAVANDATWEVSVQLEGTLGAVSEKRVVTHMQYGWPELEGAVRVASDGKEEQTVTARVPPALADGTAIRYAFSGSPTDDLDTSDVLHRAARAFTHVVGSYPSEYYFSYRIARGPRETATTSVAVSDLAVEVVEVEEVEEEPPPTPLWITVFLLFPGREAALGAPYYSTAAEFTGPLTGPNYPHGSYDLVSGEKGDTEEEEEEEYYGGGGGGGASSLVFYPQWLKWQLELSREWDHTAGGWVAHTHPYPVEFTVQPNWTGVADATGGSIDVTWTGGAERNWSYGARAWTWASSEMPPQLKQFHLAAPLLDVAELVKARNAGYSRVGWVFTPYSNVGENPDGVHWFSIGLSSAEETMTSTRLEPDGNGGTRLAHAWSYQHKRRGMPELSATLLRRVGQTPPCELTADSNHPVAGEATGTTGMYGQPATSSTVTSDTAYLAAGDSWLFDTDAVSNGHELTVNFSTSPPYEVFAGRVGAPGDGGIDAGKGLVDSSNTFSSYSIGVSMEKHMAPGWDTKKWTFDFMLHSSTLYVGDAIGFKRLRPFLARADGTMSTDT